MPSSGTTGRAAHVRAVVVAVAAAVALGACAAGGGPLHGPRVAAGEVSVCAPAGTGRDVCFGVGRLANRGDDPVEITEVTGTGDNLDVAQYFLDAEGPARGEVLGTFAWPAGEDAHGPEEAVVSRMTVPEGVVVAPGAEVALVLRPVPVAPDDVVTVDETVVRYRVGTRTYREVVRAEHRLAPGTGC